MSDPQVTFNYTAWVLRYPEFQTVMEPVAQAYFDEATIYLRNDGTGPVRNDRIQLLLLNMLTAHLAKLYATINGQPASGLVGRISQATEGSVSAGTDLNGVPGNAAWFTQTSYGLSFWQATAPYRRMRYVPGPRPNFNSIFPSRGLFE
jgi:hypothetical protein